MFRNMTVNRPLKMFCTFVWIIITQNFIMRFQYEDFFIAVYVLSIETVGSKAIFKIDVVFDI